MRISHVIHACSERYSSTLSSPFHPTSSSSQYLSISCSFSEGSSNTAYFAKKEMEPYDESYLPTDDGAIEFWKIKYYLRNEFENSQHWSDEKWKSIMARGGGNKIRFQYCANSSGEILYLRALQGHSRRNLIDP